MGSEKQVDDGVRRPWRFPLLAYGVPLLIVFVFWVISGLWVITIGIGDKNEPWAVNVFVGGGTVEMDQFLFQEIREPRFSFYLDRYSFRKRGFSSGETESGDAYIPHPGFFSVVAGEFRFEQGIESFTFWMPIWFPFLLTLTVALFHGWVIRRRVRLEHG